MRREILLSDGSGEAWSVLLEDGRPVEAAVERADGEPAVGDIHAGIVRRLVPGLQAAFVDIGRDRALFVHGSDIPESLRPAAGTGRMPVERLVHEGQRVVVQLLRTGVPPKGDRGTLRISLPGRLLVFVPEGGKQTVSRRIGDAVERERLEGLVEGIALEGEGFVVRTAGEGASADELADEADMLRRTWREIRDEARRAGAPGRLRRDEDLIGRTLRDLPRRVDAIVVEGEAAHARCRDWLARRAPSLLPALRRHRGAGGLLEERGVWAGIEAALSVRSSLPSGGNVVITPTEALVAVDVNSAGAGGGGSAGDNALTTNLEAASEILRQIRLRNLGGLIVIDFIDMESASSRQALHDLLSAELAKDRAVTRLLPVNEFGLVELTRSRSRPPLDSLLRDPCPSCSGEGRVRSSAALASEIRRAAGERTGEPPTAGWRVRVHPDRLEPLRDAGIERGDDTAGPGLRIEPDARVGIDRFEVEPD